MNKEKINQELSLDEKQNVLSNNDVNNVPKKGLLKVKDLNMMFKVRGTFKKALDDINFTVDEGDFFGIIGESGSGKTTTGKAIIRLYNATGGTIEFDNQLISQKTLGRKRNKWMRKNIQMIFQDPMSSMDPIKNVMTIVSEPLIINRIVQSETLDYMKKVWRVNNFFHYRFNEINKNSLFEFNRNYYSNTNQIYLSGIEKIRGLNLDYFDTVDNLNEYLGSIVDDVVSDLKDNVELVYKLNDKQSDLINETFIKYENNDLEEIDVRLDEANKEIIKCKENAKYSAKQKELLEELKNIEQQIDLLKSKYKNIYKSQYKGIKDGLLRKVKSDWKTSYQQKMLSTDKIQYTYFLFQETAFKEKYAILKKIYRLKYLNEKEINKISEILDILTTQRYQSHLNEILEVQNQFSSNPIEQKIDYLKFIKDKKGMLHTLKPKVKLSNVVLDQYGENLIETITIDDSSLNSININDQKIDELIVKSNTASKVTEDKFKNEINKRYAQVVKLTKLIKENGPKGSTDSIWKSKLENAISKKEEVIEERKQIIADYKLTLKDRKIELNSLKQEINLLKKEVRINKNNFKKVIKNALNIVSKKEVNNQKGFKEKFNTYKTNTGLKKALQPKILAIKSIEFEKKQSVQRFIINTLLYKSNKYTGLVLYLWIVKALIKEKVFKALRDVGLKHEHAYRYPHEFSGGQRQRIVIARALITEPKLIIADEPISALDVSIQSQVINIMKNLAKEKGVTFLFIAHDLSMVSYVCNKIIIMHNGKIVEKGEVDKIFKNPIHPYTKSLFKAIPELSRIHVNLSSFDEELDYDKDYGPLNKPTFFKVQDDEGHQVFGTEGQVLQWLEQQETKTF